MSAGFVKHSVSELRQLRTTPACWWLAFSSNELESAYQRWHAANFGSDLKGGLLLSCFFYFAASVSFAAWSRLSGVGATTATGGTVADAAIVIALPLAFACSFSSCAVKRPHAFAAMVLLCTVCFVVLRAMIFDAAAVFTAPVLLILMVCISLSTALLRMPFIATSIVGLLASLLYAAVFLISNAKAPSGSAYYPMALLLVALASALAARQLERSQRRAFLIQRAWFNARTPDAAQSGAGSFAGTSTDCGADDSLRATVSAAAGCSTPVEHAPSSSQGLLPLVFSRAAHANAPVGTPAQLAASAPAPVRHAYGDLGAVGTDDATSSASSCDDKSAETRASLHACGSSVPVPHSTQAADAARETSPARAERARRADRRVDLLQLLRRANGRAAAPSRRGRHRRAASSGSAAEAALREARAAPLLCRDAPSSRSETHIAGMDGDDTGGEGRESAYDALRLALRAALFELTGQLLGGSDAHDLTSPDSTEAVQRALQATGSSSLRQHLTRWLSDVAPLPLPFVSTQRSTQRLQPSPTADTSAAGVALPLTRLPRVVRTKFVLVRDSQLPCWHTPYPFIASSYRADFSYWLCFTSIFKLHNETLNIWTELAPAAVFAAWSVEFLQKHAETARVDRAIVAAGLWGATVLRPLCSAMAHLLHCTSATGYIFWWSVDYASICMAILASSLVSGRFAFYCMAPLQVRLAIEANLRLRATLPDALSRERCHIRRRMHVYALFVLQIGNVLTRTQMLYFASSVGLLSTSLVAVLAVASPALRAASFFLFVTFCNGVPFIYQVGAKLSGGAYHSDVPSAYLAYWGGSLGLFLFGLLVKSSHLPERAVQREWNDIFFASHQIWHLCINGAFALGTFLAWDVYLDWRSECEAGHIN